MGEKWRIMPAGNLKMLVESGSKLSKATTLGLIEDLTNCQRHLGDLKRERDEVRQRAERAEATLRVIAFEAGSATWEMDKASLKAKLGMIEHTAAADPQTAEAGGEG